MASQADRIISKRRRIVSPISSSSDEDESTQGTSNLAVSTKTSASSNESEISGLTGVVKDLVKVMELQASGDRSQRILHPRDNIVPIFNPEDKRQSIEKWCQRIDELKNLYNWSDEVTVYSATSKLGGLAETWYCSLPTIQYSWEEWKIELRKAFPPRCDFHETLQEMMRRHKQRSESYLVYYYEKVALMNECKIFGSDAVSCLLGGLSDPTIQAAARASNYTSCEELGTFLKTCDAPQHSITTTVPNVSLIGKERQVVQQDSFEPQGKRTCYKCQMTGHGAYECRVLRCFNCRRYGHKAHECSVRQHSKRNNQQSTTTENVL